MVRRAAGDTAHTEDPERLATEAEPDTGPRTVAGSHQKRIRRITCRGKIRITSMIHRHTPGA